MIGLERRFWSKAPDKPTVGCWNWVGSLSKRGYARFWHGRCREAHQVAFELANGPIPVGLVVRHTCDNPRCVRPGHLIPGTQQQNMKDAVERGQIKHGEDHSRAKLTEHDVRGIREKAALGVCVHDLALTNKVAVCTIRNIVARRIWRKV